MGIFQVNVSECPGQLGSITDIASHPHHNVLWICFSYKRSGGRRLLYVVRPPLELFRRRDRVGCRPVCGELLVGVPKWGIDTSTVGCVRE
ncbi:hypothetical protein J2S53_001242 [Actinopolyspora lacussalsi]|nr:hypothetical protein [Actinopolyspora lacussalsi]